MLEPFDDPAFAITRASAQEATRIATILRAAYAVHLKAGLNFSAATATPGQVRRRVKKHEVYVLYVKGGIVGTVTLRTKEDASGLAGYVNALAIDPTAQRSGLGSLLLERAEREWVARGLHRMRLDTAKTAYEVVGWYARRGYHFVDEVHWEGKTYDSVVMEKVLAASPTELS